MRFMEFGKSNQKIMVLIHGMQVPWQLWNDHIEFFKDQYHIIIPILSGHDTEEISTFISIEEEAKSIERFILKNYCNKVSVMCGISLGGAISALLWENKKIHIEKLFLDGAPLVPYNPLLTFFIEKQYLYMTLKSKQRNSKIIAKCENTFIPANYMNDFLKMIDEMTNETIKNCIKSISAFRLSKNCDKEIKIAYYYGTKANEYYSIKSAKLLKQFYDFAEIHCLKNHYHCELFLFSPTEHIRLIEEFVAKN